MAVLNSVVASGVRCLLLGAVLLPLALAWTSSEDAAIAACTTLRSRYPHLVAFPGSTQFVDDNFHWGVSSSQNSTCSIEPTSADEVSDIIKLVGSLRSPFAIKGAGHAYNKGHSSTTGVAIATKRLNSTTYDNKTNTVTIGTGLTWDQVYVALEPHGVMVTGGRLPGVGVGGLTLGGGYSWKTQQFGLTIDTVVAFDLVLPSGKQVHVTSSSYSDLFFGLKGGLNNFGIVTAITLEAHPQGLVWAGIVAYGPDQLDAVVNATAVFSTTNTDPKASIIATFQAINAVMQELVFIFYDGPTPAAGPINNFMTIPSLVNGVNTSTMVEFIAQFGNGSLGEGQGFAATAIPIHQYSLPVIQGMVSLVEKFGNTLTAQNNGSLIQVEASTEPFLNPNSFSKGGAYPHPASRQVAPFEPNILYTEIPGAPGNAALDAHFQEQLKEFANGIQTIAVAEGESRWTDPIYPNYAAADTPLENMYGSNVPRLREIARKYDPDGVMKLTGGFKFE